MLERRSSFPSLQSASLSWLCSAWWPAVIGTSLCAELVEFTALLTSLVKLRHHLGRNGIPKLEIGNICLDPGEIDHLEHPSHPEPPLAVEAACPPVSEETGHPLLENPVKPSPGETT